VYVSGGSGPRPAVMYSAFYRTPMNGATAIRLCYRGGPCIGRSAAGSEKARLASMYSTRMVRRARRLAPIKAWAGEIEDADRQHPLGHVHGGLPVGGAPSARPSGPRHLFDHRLAAMGLARGRRVPAKSPTCQ
jgi:hypothetical protein